MASTSLSAHTHTIKYDVFLSFRGEDTRHTFTDHLYHALLREGLRTFRDNDEIDKGEELKPEIETAIIESRASIVVLSGNYANSRWCLDELCLLLAQRRKHKHFVLPIFYHVDPSDVRNQTRSFTIKKSIWTALTDVVNLIGVSRCLECLGIEAKEGSKWTEFNVKRWKAALTEVANLTGMEPSGSETDFITNVVDTVRHKLDLKLLSTPAHLTGMETRVEAINSWLKNEQSNVIAICGMGGAGKSTLAQYIFNLHKQDFESSSFVEEIGKHYKHDVIELQMKLLRDVSQGKEIRISVVSEGTQKIEEALQMKKMLIVLDDIDDKDELSALLGTHASTTQSKIIITTRHRDIHAWFRSISWRCTVHELKLLNDLESLQLLSWHAFASRTPLKGFEDLAIQLAEYCGGNPLALKVLGSSLSVSDEDQYERNSMIEIWKERMDSLNSSKTDFDSQIQDVLRKSFDSLRLISHKELFLDIACFFVGESKDMVTTLLDDLYAKYGIMTLINKCLLSVSPNGDLMMHQLLQDMGRAMVCEESKHPKERSRVWIDVESFDILRKGYVSDTLEGLALDIRHVKQGMGSQPLDLKTSSLEKLDKLKLLKFKDVKLTGSYENFPELRWLCWHGCPLETMLPGLLKSSLVVIDMSHGDMQTFEAPTVLNSLKILNLQGCSNLVSIQKLRRLPKLETLILYLCRNFRYFSDSNSIDLKMLKTLDLFYCKRLESLRCIPSTLEKLYIEYCSSLESITFQSSRFSLQVFSYAGCVKLSDVQGLFKLVPIAKIDEADLVQQMQWIKEYEGYDVNLVGDAITDDITKGRNQPIQMLYEYGIMSTYLQGIKDHSMPTYEYTSSSGILSFCVPFRHENSKIQGLLVSCLYRSLGSKDKDMWVLLAKISNRTTGLTWIYNPVVYCKPRVDEDVVWLSYWPIGNMLDAGDEVYVNIIVAEGVMIVSKCGASIVYADGQPEQEDKCENNTTNKGEVVIEGDLSEFEVIKGGYYLCCRDLFGSETSSWLKMLFDDNVDYPESLGWKGTCKSRIISPNLVSLHDSQHRLANALKSFKLVSGNTLKAFKPVSTPFTPP